MFAANMSVIIMSLEFGRRPTKKLKKVLQLRRALWIQASISPSACPLEIHVLWLLHKARNGKLQHYSHSQSGTTLTLLKKEVRALLTRQCYGLIAHSALYLKIKKSLNPIVSPTETKRLNTSFIYLFFFNNISDFEIVHCFYYRDLNVAVGPTYVV